jgi:hypothetical protein
MRDEIVRFEEVERTPKMRPGAKAEASPGYRGEQADEQEDQATAGCRVGVASRAIRRSDRYRSWLRSNFVARQGQEAHHHLITTSIWGMSD